MRQQNTEELLQEVMDDIEKILTSRNLFEYSDSTDSRIHSYEAVYLIAKTIKHYRIRARVLNESTRQLDALSRGVSAIGGSLPPEEIGKMTVRNFIEMIVPNSASIHMHAGAIKFK